MHQSSNGLTSRSVRFTCPHGSPIDVGMTISVAFIGTSNVIQKPYLIDLPLTLMLKGQIVAERGFVFPDDLFN